jgi:tetratricopeptide (TPR) repeat protein
MFHSVKNIFTKKEQSPEAGLFIMGMDALETANQYNESRNDELALRYYDIAASCGINETFAFRGYVLQGLDYDYEAIEDFTKALVHEPDDANIYYGRHLSNSKIGDFEKALADINQAIYLAGLNTARNRNHDEIIQKSGYPNVVAFYTAALQNLKIDILMPVQALEQRKSHVKRR